MKAPPWRGGLAAATAALQSVGVSWVTISAGERRRWRRRAAVSFNAFLVRYLYELRASLRIQEWSDYQADWDSIVAAVQDVREAFDDLQRGSMP